MSSPRRLPDRDCVRASSSLCARTRWPSSTGSRAVFRTCSGTIFDSSVSTGSRGAKRSSARSTVTTRPRQTGRWTRAGARRDRARPGRGREGRARRDRTRSQGKRCPGGIEAPFLQLVMARLWAAEAEQSSVVLRLETFERLGGAEEIVSDHLEQALASLDDEQQDVAAAIFNHLVTPSGTKIAHDASDLAGYLGTTSRQLEPVLALLAAQRILRPVPASVAPLCRATRSTTTSWPTPSSPGGRDTSPSAQVERVRRAAARRHRRLLVLAVAAVLLAGAMAGGRRSSRSASAARRRGRLRSRSTKRRLRLSTRASSGGRRERQTGTT